MPKARASEPAPDQDRWVKVSGSRVRVRVTGQGPDLLLLNGIGAHAGMWEPLVAQLSATRRLIMVDMPGTGASPALWVPRRMPSLARFVIGVLNALKLDRLDVLGYSWGGTLAQQIALDHPRRVARLCLVSTLPGVGGSPPSLRVASAMLDPTRFSTRERAREAAALLYGGEYRKNGRVAAGSALVRWSDRPPSRTGYAHQLYAIAGWSSLYKLHRVRARTLIICGDDDPLVPVKNAHLMAHQLRDATVYIAPGGGHLWLLDHAEESAGVIERFLAAGRD